MEHLATKPKKITNKYDLMHRNTPMYAKTTIEWDCARMSPITKNRVLRWLKDPHVIRAERGDAASMYRELRRKFGIPNIEIPHKVRSKYNKDQMTWSGQLNFEHANEEVTCLILEVYTSERVQQRLNNEYRSWMFEDETPKYDHFWLSHTSEHDLEPLRQAVNRMMQGEEYAKKINDAVDFVNNGGKLYFTYDPTDRRYEKE